MQQPSVKRRVFTETNTFQADPQPNTFQLRHKKHGYQNKVLRLSLESKNFLEKLKKNMPDSQIAQHGLNLPTQDYTGEEMRSEVKKMMINSRHEDQYFKKNYDIKANQNDLNFPQGFRIQNDSLEDSVYKLRNDLRINRFNHTKFDPTLTSIDAKKYFKGIYEPNKSIKDEELIKSFGEFVTENGNHKIGAVKLHELFASIQASTFKLDKKIDEKQVIRDKIKKEYPKMNAVQFIDQIDEMRRFNGGRPLSMKKEDEILRYTAKKMEDFAPYNSQNMRSKIKLLKDLIDDGYELKVISPRKQKYLREQELKRNQFDTQTDLQSIQEMSEAPVISNNDEQVIQNKESQLTISIHSDTYSQTHQNKGAEKMAVNDLKDESVQQSSQINNSTLIGTNYNQAQFIESADILEVKSTIPTNQQRDEEYFSGFDDNDVTNFGDSEVNYKNINRGSDHNIFRHENSQEFLMNHQQQNEIGLQNQSELKNSTHIQSQVFVQNQSFLSHQNFKMKSGQKILANINKEMGGSSGVFQLEQSPGRNDSSESELNISGFKGRYQQDRDRFQTHQSRLDRDELPSITRNAQQETLNINYESPSQHNVRNSFSQLNEDQLAILPALNSLSKSRQVPMQKTTTFPKINQGPNKSMIKNLKESIKRNRNDRINQSLNFTPQYLSNPLNKPILYVSKKQVRKLERSPMSNGSFQKNKSKVDIQNIMNQRKLFSQSQLSPINSPQNHSPMGSLRNQTQKSPKQGIATQKVGFRQNEYDYDIVQQTNFEHEPTTNSTQIKSKTSRRKQKIVKSIFNTGMKNDITTGSQSVLISIHSPEKIEPFHSPENRSLSPTQRNQRNSKKFDTQKTSLERQSLISILHQCGNPAENEKFSSSIHLQLDKAVNSLNEDIHNIAEIYNSYTDQFDVNHQDDCQIIQPDAKNQVYQNFGELEEDYYRGKSMDYDLFLSKEALDNVKRVDNKKNIVRKRNQSDIWIPDKLKVSKVVKDQLNMQN